MLRLAVIGDPIDHSLSPYVHGASLDYLGIEYEYQKIRVTPAELKDFVPYAMDNLDGFNLTMPHKKNIFPFLNSIDESGEYYGAVNTATIKDKKMYGSNTDGIGLILALEKMDTTVKGKNVTVLGAGGAANAVIAALFKHKSAKVTIACRTPKKAFDIIDDLKDKINDCHNNNFKSLNKDCTKIIDSEAKTVKSDKTDAFIPNINVVGFSDSDLATACDAADILINTTPLGMEGVSQNFKNFDFLDSLPCHTIVSDLIYKPKTTSLMQEAKKRSYKVQNGLDMLIFQALAAEEKFLQRFLDKQSLYNQVIKRVSDYV